MEILRVLKVPGILKVVGVLGVPGGLGGQLPQKAELESWGLESWGFGGPDSTERNVYGGQAPQKGEFIGTPPPNYSNLSGIPRLAF